MKLNSVEELIQDIRLGKMVILMDDEDRENEGDLVMAAECVKPQDINFMAMHARGLICLTLTEERCQRLGLPMMVGNDGLNGTQYGTNFTVSIEAADGVTTGISAADRAHTVRTAVARNAVATDIVQPGHVFPLKARRGGVLTRAGHTEAGCDLARLAGFEAASVIVEIMNDDGSMARRPDLEIFAQKHDIKIGTIADLIHYRVINEQTIEKINEGIINTDYGQFTLHTFRDLLAGDIHFAITQGELTPDEPALVRVHFGATLRDMLGTQPADHVTWNVRRCLERIAKEGKGALVLLTGNESAEQLLDSVGIALGQKPAPQIQAQASQVGYLTIGLGSQILRELRVGKMRFMGAAIKYNAISGFDLEVVEFVSPD
jgi:3,4-dihydroxy 2-butanone 4-phosphate synthase/GTP cyclohydrolase II